MSSQPPGDSHDPVQDPWQAPASPGPLAGWYPDPWLPGQRRYWDGSAWTAHAFREDVHDAPTEQVPTPPVAPATTMPPPPEWTTPIASPPQSSPLDWTPPPPPPGRPWWPVAAALVAVAFVVGVIASQVFPAKSHHASSSATPPPITTPQLPATTLPSNASSSDPAASALTGLVLQQSDVAPDVTVGTITGGNTVSGGATLDLCNGTFPSESQRTARLQVAGVDSLGNIALSTEAVLYGTAGGTAQAFTELRSVAANCPSAPVVSPIGEPTVTTKFNAAPDSGWPQVPGVERLAYDFTTTDDTGQTQHSGAVYLRRGRVLLGVYFPQAGDTQPAVDGQTTEAAIVNVFAQRMAKLPARVVG